MRNLAWAVAALACVGCGDAKEMLQDWADKGPLEQRHQHCEDEHGDWVAQINVGACTDGNVQVQVKAQEGDNEAAAFTLNCQKGVGGEYENQCTHTDSEGRLYWNDGPSTPSIAQAVSGYFGDAANQLNWNELFWAAARNHDYCYHSGVSRNLTKDDCDNQFHADMEYVCTQPQSADKTWYSADRCNLQADAMYEAVHTQGDSAYNMTGTVVDYPAWQAPPSSAQGF